MRSATGGLCFAWFAKSPERIALLPPAIRAHVIASFVDALHSVFLVAVPVIAVACVLSFFIKELPLRGHSDAPTPESTSGPTTRVDASAGPKTEEDPAAAPIIH